MSDRPNGEAIREALSRVGKSQADIARELNVDISTVRDVISGRLQGRRGDAHKVAVALGLKEGFVVVDGMPICEAIKKAAA
jgi:gp16 family phage-associated protein